jgi:hypothetical protein
VEGLLTSVIRTQPLHFVFLRASCFATPYPPVPFRTGSHSYSPASPAMAPIPVLEPFPWPWLMADRRSLEVLVLGG